jgi:hypothetical protein
MSLTGTKILSASIAFLAPHFEGDPKTLKSYLANAAKINKTLGWRPKQLCQYVTLSIRGNAGIWLQSIPTYDRNTFAKLERALTQKYMKPTDELTFHKYLSTLSQENTGLQVAQFADEVNDYISDYYIRQGKVDQPTMQNKIREIFLSGLQPDIIKHLKIIFFRDLYQMPMDALIEASQRQEADLMLSEQTGYRPYRIKSTNRDKHKNYNEKQKDKYVAALGDDSGEANILSELENFDIKLNEQNEEFYSQQREPQLIPPRRNQDFYQANWANFANENEEIMQNYNNNQKASSRNRNKRVRRDSPDYTVPDPQEQFSNQTDTSKRTFRKAVFDNLMEFLNKNPEHFTDNQLGNAPKQQNQNVNNNKSAEQSNRIRNPEGRNNNQYYNTNSYNNNNNYYKGRIANTEQTRSNQFARNKQNNNQGFRNQRTQNAQGFNPERICPIHQVNHHGVCPDTRCFICGELGHLATMCITKHCTTCEPHVPWHKYSQQCGAAKALHNGSNRNVVEESMLGARPKNVQQWRDQNQGRRSLHNYANAN